MRGTVYAVAVLAAAGIMYAIATMPPEAATPTVETVAAESSEVMTEADLATVKGRQLQDY